MGKGKFIVEAPGFLPEAYDDRDGALRRVMEHKRNGVEAKLIDLNLNAENQDDAGFMFAPSRPPRGW